MSAEAVGMHMPAVVTLDDVAAMNAADPNGYRYETSPKGFCRSGLHPTRNTRRSPAASSPG